MMSPSAADLLATVRRNLAPAEAENPLVPLITAGEAPVAAVAALAAEETHIVAGDRRSFLTLAARSTDSAATDFFSTLAQGESLALPKLPALAAAAGMSGSELSSYEPQPGAQAYSAYVAWLALNAEPAAVALALLANFAEWGAYCAAVARGLREHYGFDDEACGFLDFFATPTGELEAQGLQAVQAGLDAGRPLQRARRYGRLLQSYELMFWRTLADGTR